MLLIKSAEEDMEFLNKTVDFCTMLFKMRDKAAA
jgi:hypothetical protein